MAKTFSNLPSTVKETIPAKKTKKQVTLAVSRILKKHKFSPLERLLLEVYPYLNPEKQADILLSVMGYMYPKIRSAEVGPKTKKRPLVQVNQQFVSPSQPTEQSQQIANSNGMVTVEDLIRIASADPEKK